jgi:redox-sensitive bicupin YhaK (pirin superfamily)
MSGPLDAADASADPTATAVAPPVVELTDGREATVGTTTVRRLLPRHNRRTVGAWCFTDHFGPEAVSETAGLDIGPHPHIGLHTVTWLLAGAMLHRDSLGSEQLIRPGQLNLMTAGEGIAHAEQHVLTDSGASHPAIHGVQLWIAQPEPTRHGPPAFAHHADLPRTEIDGAVATVLVGELAGVTSPARQDTDLVGADLAIRPGATSWPLRRDFEHALVVLDGEVALADAASVDAASGQAVVRPGRLAYVGRGRESLELAALEPSRVLLLGGVPFEERIVMWWNFVARTKEELARARTQWSTYDERFGEVASPLPRLAAPPAL